MKLLIAGLVVGIMFIVGTVGYIHIEGWNILDSLYMTAITLTSVGYQEVHPLSREGRVFTIFLATSGYGTLAAMIALISSFLIDIEFKEIRRFRKMEKRLNKLTDHYIICGGGDITEKVIEEFARGNIPYVIIEQDENRVNTLLEKHPEIIYVRGDATDEDILKKARVEKARGLIATFPSDADNLFVVTSARAINPGLRIVSRAAREETQRKLSLAGVDAVILPDLICALRMASLAIRPHVVSFLDILTGAGGLTLNLEEVKIPPESNLVGKTLGEANIPRETGLIVIATKKKDAQDFQFNPLSTTRINPHDILIVLGSQEQIKRLKEYVGKKR